MTKPRIAIVLGALAIILGIFASPPHAADDAAGGTVAILTISGGIGPATSDYFVRGLEKAEADGARLVILVMDTPGGLVASTRDIIKAILSSTVPVVTYVSPSGSRAASAGTYIMYASHVAAMAPATNLGAATPVALGPQPPAPVQPGQPPTGDDPESGEPAPEAAPGGTAMERKVINDAIAYIRSLAEMRDRNADWAEEAVRTGASLSATKALEMNVIDLMANNLGELLEQIDGRTVSVNGIETTLATSGLLVERIEPDWRTQLLETLTNPTIAYGLLLIGIYGLLFEGYNPGAIVPGVVGAICLLVALYALQVLDVNYAGLALILLGVVLMISEIFVPSFGALGLGGIIAFIIGSIILIDTDVPGLGIDRMLIGSMAAVGGGVIMAIVWFAVRARQMPVVTGRQELVGAVAEAVTAIDGEGTVFVHGENWTATSKQPVSQGQRVKIVAMHGLKLEVEPYHS